MAFDPALWRLQKGSARRRVNVETGETISRRQFENQRIAARERLPSSSGAWSRIQTESRIVKQYGWQNERDYRDTVRDSKFDYFAGDAFIMHGGRYEDYLRPDSEFSRLYLAARDVGFDTTAAGRDPDGPFAELLVYLGLREEDDTHDVGDTGEI